MGGELLYKAPMGHGCGTPPWEPHGSVWRCGDCGTYWRVDALPLMARADWHPMSRVAVWWFKRKQATRERAASPG